MVDPKDAASVALGFVAEASQADVAKYPKYAAGQACGNCALYGGKAGDAAGPCPLFVGKQVGVKSWCSAYAKKAA
ncbi:MAG: high-potential iron-sulfur protein [Pseudorhodobacter sp.]|nr:high-potential iron-sulfur protein [Rhizobacter sp.]